MVAQNNKDSIKIGNEACPKCVAKGNDSSGDNLVTYHDGGKHCFACGHTVLSDTYKEINGYKNKVELVFPVTEFSKEQWEDRKLKLTTDPKGFRGLKKYVCDFYRVYHEIDEESGKVVNQYYPISKDNVFSGVKKRITTPEKNFVVAGYNSKTCDLFGQALFLKSPSKNIILTCGELDALSVWQMLDENTRAANSRNNTSYETPPVVSGTVGEMGNIRQYMNNYSFLERFDKIIYIPDRDEAGEAALEQLAKALPKDKLFIVDLPAKDPNKMLEDGRQSEFIHCYIRARAYSPAGILGSDVIYEKILERALIPKIPFPPIFDELNDALGGGISLGHICNITAGCVDKYTEFLSKDGWKYIKDYNDGDLVAQYNHDEEHLELVQPLEYIVKPESQFYHITNPSQEIDQMLSAEHRFVYFDNAEQIHEVLVKDLIQLKEIPTDTYIKSYDDDLMVEDFIHLNECIITPVTIQGEHKYCFSVPSSYLVLRRNGHIFVTGNSGAGKSTVVNEFVLHQLHLQQYRCGVVSLEADAGEYGENLLGAHIRQKLQDIKDPQEKHDYIASDAVKKAAKELFTTIDGLPSFHLIDDRGDYTQLQKKIEELIISCGVQVIVIDVLSDVFAGQGLVFEQQWMAWEKKTVKRYNVSIINVIHIRKAASNQKAASAGGTANEEDMTGSAAQYQSAAINIQISRNKMAETERERNTINVALSKNRATGITSPSICKLFYDRAQHRLYALLDYFGEEEQTDSYHSE